MIRALKSLRLDRVFAEVTLPLVFRDGLSQKVSAWWGWLIVANSPQYCSLRNCFCDTIDFSAFVVNYLQSERGVPFIPPVWSIGTQAQFPEYSRIPHCSSVVNISRAKPELSEIQSCCLAGRSVSKQALLYRFDTSTTKLLVERRPSVFFYCLVRNDMWQFDWLFCDQPGLNNLQCTRALKGK